MEETQPTQSGDANATTPVEEKEVDLLMLSTQHPEIIQSLIQGNKAIINQLIKHKLKTMPMHPKLWRSTAKGICENDIGMLVCICCPALRVGTCHNREVKQDFKCEECGAVSTYYTNLSIMNSYDLPICNGMVKGKESKFQHMINVIAHKKDKQTDKEHKCKSNSYTKVENTTVYKDYQEIKIGSQGKSITVLLNGDLTKKCQTGDMVSVIGKVDYKINEQFKGKKSDIDLVIVANNITVLSRFPILTDIGSNKFKNIWKDQNLFSTRSTIVRAFASHIIRREEEKLAILLSLIGAPNQCNEEATQRGKIHALLIGEPATGKTQLLKYAHKLANRSVWTTGMGCSTAGLTVTAVKLNSDWTLEAGALVLADGGVCCIDDFHLMKKDDRNAIHEAMEQQTISMAKAGMICHLNTRATILAATSLSKNSKYDFTKDIEQNTGLSSSLLSRFDLIFIMCHTYSASLIDEILLSITHSKPKWTLEDFKNYISDVQVLKPKLSTASQNIFSKYFGYIRCSEFVNKDRKTVRFMEGMIRLGQAHARLMQKDTVSLQDAVLVVYLLEYTLRTGMFDTDIWVETDEDYYNIEQQCLRKLKMDIQSVDKLQID